MKKKSLWITAILTILIIVSGTIALPFFYSVFVNVPSIIDEQTKLPETVGTELSRFMTSLQFPLFEETKPLSEIEIKDYRDTITIVEEGEEIENKSTYNNRVKGLFDMVGFTYQESVWNTLSLVKNAPEYYMLNAQTEREGNVYSLYVAMKNYFPVLLYCENLSKPSAQELKQGVEALWKYADTQDDYLYSYLCTIDKTCKNYIEYEEQINKLYLALIPENKKAEDDEASLSVCCSYGKWQVYSDNKIAALICIMGKSYFVLYYDTVEQSFCGFRNGIA